MRVTLLACHVLQQEQGAFTTMMLHHTHCGTLSISAKRSKRTSRSHTVAKASSQQAYSNPIGVHALVFAGDWTEQSATAAAAGMLNHPPTLLTVSFLFLICRVAVSLSLLVSSKTRGACL